MTLTDTGPLVALLDRGDPAHATCVGALSQLSVAPFLTTWPCFTEAMYMLWKAGGYRRQLALWEMVDEGRVQLHELDPAALRRTRDLMMQYRDTPMDLADASLVAVAEQLRARRIFTLDGHFRIYRMPDGSVLEMIPA